MYLFSVSTSSPSQTSCQVVAGAKRKYAHRGVPVQVGLIWSSGTNITTRCETRPNQENKLTAKTCKESTKSILQLVKLQVNMNVDSYSLFQETHFARRLLPLFVLIDKKLRQFLRARTSNTSPRPNRGGQVILFFPQMMTRMLFSNSRNHPILPPLNTHSWT